MKNLINIFLFFILIVSVSCAANKKEINNHAHETSSSMQFKVSYKATNIKEINGFIKKLKIAKEISINNDLSTHATLRFTCVNANDLFDRFSLESLPLKSGENTFQFTIDSNEKKGLSCPLTYLINSLRINIDDQETKKNAYINIIKSNENLSIELSLVKKHPSLLSQIQFDDYYFIQCYSEVVEYVRFFFPSITMFDIINIIKNDFDTIYLKKISKEKKSPPVSIPMLTHHIWMTSDTNPKDLNDSFIVNIDYTAKVLPGWDHILWVYNSDKIPNTILKINKLGRNIKIKNIEDFNFSNPEDKQIITSLISEKKFGLASDFFRVIALHNFGGVYFDTDYIVLENITPITNNLTFFASFQPHSALIGNAIVGSIKDHPILSYMYRKIKENIHGNHPAFLNKFNMIHQTIFKSGPGVLLHAYYVNRNTNENYFDVIFPSSVFYPTSNERPYPKNFLSPNEPYPPIALGQHFWEGQWFKEGNNG